MDPNETLGWIRRFIAAYWEDKRCLTPTGMEEIFDLFDDLDRWITNGGFLPTDWQNDESEAKA
jgi:hypothetical protein